MDSMLALHVVDLGFNPMSGQTKNHKIVKKKLSY
jgi:hypothetical protein